MSGWLYTGYNCVLKYDQIGSEYRISPPAWYIQLKIEKVNYWPTYSDFVILSEIKFVHIVHIRLKQMSQLERKLYN